MYTECALCDSTLQSEYRQRQWDIVATLESPQGRRYLKSLSMTQLGQLDLFQLGIHTTYTTWRTQHRIWVATVLGMFLLGDEVDYEFNKFNVLTHLPWARLVTIARLWHTHCHMAATMPSHRITDNTIRNRV